MGHTTVGIIGLRRSLLIGGTAAGMLAGLAITNPTPSEFEAFAGDQLSTLASRELCRGDQLALFTQLVIANCHQLVHDQRSLLGQLARQQSQRLNLGLISLYNTEVGGQQVFPHWRVPLYGISTLGVAGQFVVLNSGPR